MDNETPSIIVTCPECKKQMRMRNPQTPGTYKITCPFCSKPFPVKIVDNAAPKPAPQAPQPQPKPQPKPTEAADEPVVIQFCSSCGMKLRIRNPQPGQHNVRCPKCQSVQTYTYTPTNAGASEPDNTETRPVEKAVKTKPVQKNVNLFRGCLMQQRGHFRSDRLFELAGKETIVGRMDTDAPCDVMVDDPTMSRRSVSIVAESKPTGILYKMTVLNATNRVTHNGKVLAVGMSDYLEFGDTLTMGKTTFKFEKAPNQNL